MLAQSEGAERRLLLVVGAVMFVDTMFYAAIAPLLPTLTRQLALSKLAAGVMTASYPAGTLIGALPGGVLAVRVGPKQAVYLGLALLACSTLAFGLLHPAGALDAARLVEGVGGACSWAGGLAWIIAQAPAQRRGALMGGAMGAAIGGALLGPVIGTSAVAFGRAPAFGAVVIVALALIAAAARLESLTATSGQGLRELRAACRNRRVGVAMWLVALPAIASGALNVLGPLRLHRLGAGAVAIGGVYLAATAVEAAISPAVGRLSDRRGRIVPLRFGLAAATAVLLCFTLAGTPLLLAGVIVAIVAALGVFWAPAMAMLSDAAAAHGLEQGLAAALINLAWAGGQVLGAGAGGAVAKAHGDAPVIFVLAVLCALTLVALGRL
ncbi:MAG: MFS transporter [Solirubrobacteraceae bacterium]